MGTMYEGLDFYRAELLRRETARGTAELIGLTRELRWLTITVAIAAILALVIALSVK